MFESLNFPELLILLLVGLLFFKENLLVWLGDKFGVKKKDMVPPWAQELQQYFNHDTTSHHEKTHSILKEISDKMDRHNDMEKENHAKLEEILKYGVKCRDK